jgi:PTS system galactitol-specific IIB component
MSTKPVTILVACGTGIATSTVVSVSIQEALEEKGYTVNMRQCKTAETQGKMEGVDLIVTTTQLSGDYGVPIIQTLAFITGIGKDQALQQIIEAVDKVIENKK